MEDKEERDETVPRGNEWEVVSLTASTYAAAPGPKDVDSSHNSMGMLGEDNEAETSSALFMSGHFIFPPSQHENLPVEPILSETHDDNGGEYDKSHLVTDEGGKSMMKDEEVLSIKRLADSHEFPRRVSASDADFAQEVIFNKEKSISITDDFNSKTNIDNSYIVEEGEGNDDTVAHQDQESDPVGLFQRPAEAGKCNESSLPCEAWWKRRAVSIYINAKEANTFWSVFIAAAVMGLIIIGHQCQHERWKVLHLKWKLGVSDERMSKIIGSISRFKAVIDCGHRRGSLIRGSASKEL